jgi:hypothetical protein
MSTIINRPPVVLSARNEQRTHACPADEVPHLDAKTQRLALADRICLTLFDRWCEQRNVLALAYLMYGWPLTGDDPSLVRRLVQSLHEFGKHHHEALQSKDAELLDMLMDCERYPVPA